MFTLLYFKNMDSCDILKDKLYGVCKDNGFENIVFIPILCSSLWNLIANLFFQEEWRNVWDDYGECLH